MEKTRKPDRGELSPEQHQRISELVGQIFELSRGFKIFPPREVTDDPAVLSDQFISERLMDTKWWLRFQDGSEEMLSYSELLALVYQLRDIKRQLDQAKSNDVRIKCEFAMKHLLEPDAAIDLLASLDLEGVERKRFTMTYPIYALHDGEEGQDAALIGAQHPQTGHNIVFAFTDEDQAATFAALFGRGRVTRIAENIDELRAVLKRGTPEVIALDPVCRDGRVDVKMMILVKTILGR